MPSFLNSPSQVPTVSLIVANFNGMDYLRKTIPLWLTHSFHQIIIADAQSDELPQFDRVETVVGPVLGGKNAAVNAAVATATSDLIFLIDNDLTPSDDFSLIDLIDASRTCGQSLTLPTFNQGAIKTKYYGRTFGITFLKYQSPRTQTELLTKHLTKVEMFSHNLLLSRSLFLALGGYCTVIPFGCDDNEFSLHLAHSGHLIYLYSKAHIQHHGITNRSSDRAAYLWWHHIFAAHWCISHYYAPKIYKYSAHVITSIYLGLNAMLNAIYYRNIRYLPAYINGYVQYWKLSTKQAQPHG